MFSRFSDIRAARIGLASLALSAALAVGLSIPSTWLSSAAAAPLGDGCAAANAGSFNVANLAGGPTTFGSASFAAGDQLTVKVSNATGGTIGFSMGFSPSSTDLIGTTAVNNGTTLTSVLAFSSARTGALQVQTNDPDLNLTMTCAKGAGNTKTQQQDSHRSTTEKYTSLTVRLLSQRVTAFGSSRTQTSRLPGNSQRSSSLSMWPSGSTGKSTPSTPAARVNDDPAEAKGVAGGNGKSAFDGLSLWGNVTWSGLSDDTAVAGSDGNAYVGIAGADYLVNDRFLVGVGLSFFAADYKSRVNTYKANEFSVGVNPYAAFRITDEISVDAMFGYAHAFATAKRSGAEGDYGADRYFVASNLSISKPFGDFRILGTTGVMWGQSFSEDYTESDGTRVEGGRVDIGTYKLSAQPSYMVLVDKDAKVFLEPFLVAEWAYDFTITKISGHNNDRDGFRIGGGANLFALDHLTANLQASTVLGRQDRGETTVQGTVRYSF